MIIPHANSAKTELILTLNFFYLELSLITLVLVNSGSYSQPPDKSEDTGNLNLYLNRVILEIL